jgi:hypothetical protein
MGEAEQARDRRPARPRSDEQSQRMRSAVEQAVGTWASEINTHGEPRPLRAMAKAAERDWIGAGRNPSQRRKDASGWSEASD